MFQVKKRAEFTDILGVDWKDDIEEDGTPVMATMQATGDPLHIEWLTPGDDIILNPIKGSIATLNIECNTDSQYIDLYNSGSMVFKRKIYCGDTLYWQGWVNSDYTEPYSNPPYTVSIVASDGLGMLKNILYDNAGTAYEDRDYQHNILLNIFAKIGYTQFTEYCNIYEDRMDDGVADSPFVQCLADNDVFAGLDCYTVLEAILKPYNAIIRQLDGEFVIFRPVELKEAIVYGRIITAGSVTGTSIDPDQFLNRPGLTDSSDLIDVNGGVLMMQPPIKKFTAYQDYGYKESWIDNHRFAFDSDTHTFEAWTIHGGDNFHPLQYRTGEPEGLLINPATAQFITQPFGDYARASGADVFRFEFDYKFINATGSVVTNTSFNIALINGSTPYYLKHPASDDDTTVQWTTTISYLTITVDAVAKGEGQWQTWTRYVTGLPEDGALQVVLYSHPTLSLCINNVRFYATSDNIITLKKKVDWLERIRLFTYLTLAMIPAFSIIMLTKYFQTVYDKKPEPKKPISDVKEVVVHEYVATNAINGKDMSVSYILGDVTDTGIDNVLEQFKGSLCISITGSLTQTESWHTRGNTEGLRLLQIAANEIADLHSKGRHFVQLPMEENEGDPTNFRVTYNLQDPINMTGAVKCFAVNRASLDVKMREWSADIIEIGVKATS